jgi:hypothetical protein
LGAHLLKGTQFTCFSGTKVRILTQKTYRPKRAAAAQVLSLLALLVQKYKSEGAHLLAGLSPEEVTLRGVGGGAVRAEEGGGCTGTQFYLIY